jgi:uncharacterized membrane protein
VPRAPSAFDGLRFGVSQGDGGAEGARVDWLLARNCSISPKQLSWAYGGLCALSLLVASFFWLQGARMVMPFAWLELLALGAAMIVFARHAGDREHIALEDGRLTVELVNGRQVDRVEFERGWVRVEPEYSERSLIELSSRGRKVAVGRHLRPELRPLLADELRHVLRGRRWGSQPGTV